MKYQFMVTLKIDPRTGEPQLLVGHDDPNTNITYMAAKDVVVDRSLCQLKTAGFEVHFESGSAWKQFLETRGNEQKVVRDDRVHYAAGRKTVGEAWAVSACGIPKAQLTLDNTTVAESMVTCPECKKRLR